MFVIWILVFVSSGLPIAQTKDNLPLNEYLVQRRKFLKIRLADLGLKTGIPNKYIKRIESGDWQNLPSGVYARGFLKKYAQVVGLDEGEVARRYDLETSWAVRPEKPSVKLRLPISGLINYLDFWRHSSLRRLLAAVVSVFVAAYIVWQFTIIFAQPDLNLSYPNEDITVASSGLELAGHVSPGSNLTINGEEVYPQPDGTFKKQVELLAGMNVLEIKAVSRFGKESKVIRKVTYQPGVE